MATDTKIPLFIRRVMPNATEAQLCEATETFKRYMKIIIAIHERIETDSHEIDS
jgi:hypothetical protein